MMGPRGPDDQFLRCRLNIGAGLSGKQGPLVTDGWSPRPEAYRESDREEYRPDECCQP
jgi:hypothetical protein